MGKLVRKLLLTFDYELYLGQNSGLPHNCILEPTRRIISLLSKYQLKAIFFVDTLYLKKLEENIDNQKLNKHFTEIKKQIVSLIKDGHYVFPHIHAHWLNAKLNADGVTWNLSNLSKYRFHNISTSEKEFVFQTSMEIIENLYQDANVELPIMGYRAGGWAIQPFTDFWPYFKKWGITYDFSVLPEHYNLSENQFFDFRNFPTQFKYSFTENKIEKENTIGTLIEFPISVVKFSKSQKLISKFLEKILWRLKIRAFGRGVGAKLLPAKAKGNVAMASIEEMNVWNLKSYVKYFKIKDGIHLIAHPKMLSKHSMFCFKTFLSILHKNYQIESDFVKF